MPRRVHEIQTSFSGGEFDPLMAEREDVESYYQSAKEMTNVSPVPQGGFRRRDGTEFISKLRNEISPVSTAGATLDAPEGGTAGDAVDGSEATSLVTTTVMNAINPYVVLHVDFTVATAIDLVDVVNMSLSTGSIDGEFRVQYSTDDAVWVDYSAPFNLAEDDRSRRRSDGPGNTVTARYWRVARVGSTSLAATISLAEIKFFAETSVLSSPKLMPFTFSDDQQYILVLTDQNLDMFSGGVWVASSSVPYLNSEADVVNWTQSLDTLVNFHKNHQPYRTFRQGSDDEWDFRAQPFTNVPQFDYGDSPGGVDEVQKIRFVDWLAGETFNIFLDTERTSSIAFGASIAATATSIQTALRALPNTSDTGITCVGSGDAVTITFGGEDGLTNWPEANAAILTTVAGVILESTVTEGKAPGEDIISDSRGWPRCGSFYQGRLFMAGFRSLPSHWQYSVAGDFFNLDDRTITAEKGAVATADTDQAAVIYQMFAGRHMQLFTSSSEFYMPLEPITPLSTSIKQTTRRGTPEGVRVVENEGATFFIQKGGNALREYLFTDAEQSYKANPISLRAGHMILNPTSVAIHASPDTDGTDIYMMVNGTSDATQLMTLRDENITAFVRARTDGLFLSVASEDLGALYVATERLIDGALVHYLEKFSDEQFMDAGAVYNVAPDTTELNGLDWLEGREIHFIIDGSPAGTAVVTAGHVDLPETAQSQVILGLNFVPYVETQPVKTRLPNGTSAGRKKRITKVDVSVLDTTNIEIGANGNTPEFVPFRQFGDDLLDTSLASHAFTGTKRVSGLRGWVEGASVVITQSVPGKMTVRSITKTVAATSS